MLTTNKVTSTPNTSKPWYCQKSPTGAHHWFISDNQERCVYCRAVREMREVPSVRWSNNQYFPYGKHKGS